MTGGLSRSPPLIPAEGGRKPYSASRLGAGNESSAGVSAWRCSWPLIRLLLPPLSVAGERLLHLTTRDRGVGLEERLKLLVLPRRLPAKGFLRGAIALHA